MIDDDDDLDRWRRLLLNRLYGREEVVSALLPGGLLMLAGLFLVFWLLPGPRALTREFILDVHTMVFGVIFTLLGAQILSIGAFAKVFCYAARFDRAHMISQYVDAYRECLKRP